MQEGRVIPSGVPSESGASDLHSLMHVEDPQFAVNQFDVVNIELCSCWEAITSIQSIIAEAEGTVTEW